MPSEEMIALLKTAHNSLAIRFGTSAPFNIGRVSAESIGFAGIRSVVVTVFCRYDDLDALVPIVRQRVYGELAERGWGPDDIVFRPTVQTGRIRKFTDENESSESYGRNKMGNEHRFSFEMERDLGRATFQGGGSFKQLPTKGETDG